MTLRYLMVGSLTASLLLGIGTYALAEGTVEVYANGEALATQGFLEPELTRDGWELRFDHVFVTLAAISAMQTNPPYDAVTGADPATDVTVAFDDLEPVTIDLTETGTDSRILVASAPAPAGQYNAITWSVVPATQGDWLGQSMVLIGTAMRDGVTKPFTLTSAATQRYVCGEYIGDSRKGFITAGGTADLELTFHLDHIFGRLDKGPDDAMNTGALGFDVFAEADAQIMDLEGLHIGHVGEGHCSVSYN